LKKTLVKLGARNIRISARGAGVAPGSSSDAVKRRAIISRA
jgi:hypothetical protein